MRQRILLGVLALVSMASLWDLRSLEVWWTTPEASSLDVAAVRAEVEGLGVQVQEAVWNRVYWESDPEQARARSRETGRPIFLFSMWGELDGRC